MFRLRTVVNEYGDGVGRLGSEYVSARFIEIVHAETLAASTAVQMAARVRCKCGGKNLFGGRDLR